MITNTKENRDKYIKSAKDSVSLWFKNSDQYSISVPVRNVDWNDPELVGFVFSTPEEDEAWASVEGRMDVVGQNGNNGEHYDNVNHPEHYQSDCGIECIDAIKAALTPDEFRGYCKGNAIKYAWRERKKGGNESLQKAVWYLNKATK